MLLGSVSETVWSPIAIVLAATAFLAPAVSLKIANASEKKLAISPSSPERMTSSLQGPLNAC